MTSYDIASIAIGILVLILIAVVLTYTPLCPYCGSSSIEQTRTKTKDSYGTTCYIVICSSCYRTYIE